MAAGKSIFSYLAGLFADSAKEAEEASTSLAHTPDAGLIRAWHGSPHTFDRFDISKVGSGEGTQAFGHGLYFTSDKDLAESFKNRLAQKTPFQWMQSDDPLKIAAGARSAFGDDAEPGLRQLTGGFVNPIGPVGKALSLIKRGADLPEVPPGRLYDTALPEGKYLDWNGKGEDGRTGWNVYDSAVSQFGSPKSASDALRDQGYAGVTYAPAHIPGARNYSLFDDKGIDILKRYAVPGAITVGAGAAALAPPQAHADTPTGLARLRQLADIHVNQRDPWATDPSLLDRLRTDPVNAIADAADATASAFYKPATQAGEEAAKGNYGAALGHGLEQLVGIGGAVLPEAKLSATFPDVLTKLMFLDPSDAPPQEGFPNLSVQTLLAQLFGEDSKDVGRRIKAKDRARSE